MQQDLPTRQYGGCRVYEKQMRLWLKVQVLGHAKTMLVLLGGWLFFGDRIIGIQLIGIVLAVAGMLLYGVCTR